MMTAARTISLLITLALLSAGPAVALASPQDEVPPKPEADELEEPEWESEPEPESEAEPEPEIEAEPEPVEVEEKPEAKEEKEEKKKDKGKDEDDVLEVGGRVHVGFDAHHYHNENTEWEDTFHIRRARLKVTWSAEDWLDARFQIDAATTFTAGNSFVKDAWIRLKPLRQLEIKTGFFKKPFSALALMSSGELKVVERGTTNATLVDYAVTSGNGSYYGGRDIGLQLGGRLVETVRLDYALGVFNGSGLASVDFDKTKDVGGRLSIRPVKPLSIGVNGMLRFFDDTLENHPWLAVAGGADVQVKLAGFRAHAETILGHNFVAKVLEYESHPSPSDVDLAFGALGILSYKFKLDSDVKMAIEPVVKIEFLDPNDRIVDDEVWLYTIGLNTYVGKYVRVMLDFEIMRAERNWDDDSTDPSLEVDDHQERLLLLVCFDI